MSKQNKTYLFRMTHIKNVPHILQYGITHKNSANANANFTPIGDSSLIDYRSNFILYNGKELGDYIPFYFGTRMPMLYVIQKGFNGVPVQNAENIVYCVTSVKNISTLSNNIIFTDGHATDTFSKQYTNKNINNLTNLLDWNAIKTTNWKNESDLDLKRRMQAEFLIDVDIPFNAILGFAVYNKTAEKKLLSYGIAPKQIKIKTNFYFHF